MRAAVKCRNFLKEFYTEGENGKRVYKYADQLVRYLFRTVVQTLLAPVKLHRVAPLPRFQTPLLGYVCLSPQILLARREQTALWVDLGDVASEDPSLADAAMENARRYIQLFSSAIEDALQEMQEYAVRWMDGWTD